MDACEGHENQSQALIQYAPSEIPTGVLFPQLTALSLGPQHHILAPARTSALISKIHNWDWGWGLGLGAGAKLQSCGLGAGAGGGAHSDNVKLQGEH